MSGKSINLDNKKINKYNFYKNKNKNIFNNMIYILIKY